MMQIDFNGKKSFTDFELILNYFRPQPPQPNVIKINVPFANGSLDFSTIGSFGELTYQERKIECSFQLSNKSRAEMFTRYSEILRWLMQPEKQKLIYSEDFARYYLAKIESEPSWENLERLGTLKVDFVADPFKYHVDVIGDDIWDDFCFLTDYTQYTNQFYISSATNVIIYNAGINITPIINSSANMIVTFEGKTYNLSPGDNNLYDLKLKNGINNLYINGTGIITIKFREQFL